MSDAWDTTQQSYDGQRCWSNLIFCTRLGFPSLDIIDALLLLSFLLCLVLSIQPATTVRQHRRVLSCVIKTRHVMSWVVKTRIVLSQGVRTKDVLSCLCSSSLAWCAACAFCCRRSSLSRVTLASITLSCSALAACGTIANALIHLLAEK